MQKVKQYLRQYSQPRVIIPVLLTLLWMAATLLLPNGFLRASFSVFFLSTLPGYTLYRVLIGYSASELKTKILGYSVGLSLIMMMVIGLIVNQTLPLFGHLQPLTTNVLTFAVGIPTLLLGLAMTLRVRPKNQSRQMIQFWRLRVWRKKVTALPRVLLVGFLLLLPILAIGGATTLNNGGTGWLSLTTVGLVGIIFLTLAWTNKGRLLALYPLALYTICLAILLGTSMRGWDITGHDVMQEFQVFQLTIQHAFWSMQQYQDAYTACLSITILPAMFQKLTGIADPYIFKLVFQILFALIAPVMYTALRNYVPRKAAFLAVFVFMTFPTFLTDVMMLNRQEIALLCLALALLVTLDKQLPKLQRNTLSIIFLGGMVLSHYSTSYIAISVLATVMVLGVVLHLLRPWLTKLKFKFGRRSHFSLFPPYVVVAVLAMIVCWNGLATHTAGNISQTIVTIGTDLTRIVNPAAVPALPKSTINPHAGTMQQFLEFARQGRALPAIDYYPAAAVSQATPVEISQTTDSLTPLVKVLHAPAAAFNLFYSLIRQGYVAFIGGLIVLGLLLMSRKRMLGNKLPNQYVLLGIGSLLVVGLQIVLPADAVNYGLARVIQQSLLLLALPVVIAALWLLGKLHVPRHWRPRVIAVGLTLLFLIMSSFASTLTGGFKPALAFNNSGFYYEAYYTHQDEITADRWLAKDAPKGSRVYADEFSRRKMIAYAGIFAQPTLVPAAIPIDSYVYLSNGNNTFREIPAYYKGQLIFYKVPYDFLDTQKNLLYNGGQVLIYK